MSLMKEYKGEALVSWRADLHCHTTCSDGTMRPSQLIEHAHILGLKGLSITDHDSIEAYKEAAITAKLYNVLFLPGIELSTTHKGMNIHLLGYSFSPDNSTILALCEKHAKWRYERAAAIVAKLNQLGIALSMEDVGGSSIGRPHIALALIKKGAASSVAEAFALYLAEGRPAYIPHVGITVEEALTAIHIARGVAVLAHPHLIRSNKIANDLLSMPFDGIECYYARFPAHSNARWLVTAAKRGLLITGGSDFHGDIKPNNPLGSSWVDEKHFMALWSHYNSQVRREDG